jgi:hypothetical protein
MRRVLHRHFSGSFQWVVDQINAGRVAVLEAENDPPVGAYFIEEFAIDCPILLADDALVWAQARTTPATLAASAIAERTLSGLSPAPRGRPARN